MTPEGGHVPATDDDVAGCARCAACHHGPVGAGAQAPPSAHTTGAALRLAATAGPIGGPRDRRSLPCAAHGHRAGPQAMPEGATRNEQTSGIPRRAREARRADCPPRAAPSRPGKLSPTYSAPPDPSRPPSAPPICVSGVVDRGSQAAAARVAHRRGGRARRPRRAGGARGVSEGAGAAPVSRDPRSHEDLEAGFFRKKVDRARRRSRCAGRDLRRAPANGAKHRRRSNCPRPGVSRRRQREALRASAPGPNEMRRPAICPRAPTSTSTCARTSSSSPAAVSLRA